MKLEKKPLIIRWIAFLLILLLGVFFRLSYNANTVPDGYIRGDAKFYLIYAHNLIAHSSFSKDKQSPSTSDSFWSPGYPLFLAAVLKATKTHNVDNEGMLVFTLDSLTAILNAQVLLGAGTIIVCFLLAALCLPGNWALLPPLLVSFSPHLVATGYYVLSETLFTFLLLSSIYLIVKALDRKNSLWFFSAGIVAALTYLVNPVSLFLAPLFVFVLIFEAISSQNNTSVSRRKYLVYLAPVLLVIVGWSVRGTISVADDQQSSGDRLLVNLSSGLYSDYHEKWKEAGSFPNSNIEIPGTDTHSYQEFSMKLFNRLSTQPMQTLSWYVVQKPVLLFSWDLVVAEGGIYVYRVLSSPYESSNLAIFSYSLMKSLHVWLVLSAFLGLIFIWKGRSDVLLVPRLLYLSVVYVSLVYVATQSAPRYSIPLRPEVYICAVFFLWQTKLFVSKIRDRALSK